MPFTFPLGLRGRQTPSITLLYYNIIRSFFLSIPLAFLVSTSVALFHGATFFTENTVGVKSTLCTSIFCSYTDPELALGSNDFVQYTLGTFPYIIFPFAVRPHLEQIIRMITFSGRPNVLPALRCSFPLSLRG